jgi:hypothetical protein
LIRKYCRRGGIFNDLEAKFLGNTGKGTGQLYIMPDNFILQEEDTCVLQEAGIPL